VALGLREMYAFQPRLEQPRGKRALRLLEQPRFRAAFDLLALRAQLGLAPAEIAAWWTRLQEVSPEERVRMLDALPRPRPAAKTGNAAGSAAPRAIHGLDEPSAAPQPSSTALPAGADDPQRSEDAAATDEAGAAEGTDGTPRTRTRRRRRRRRGFSGPA
jgi:hypothetical protein